MFRNLLASIAFSVLSFLLAAGSAVAASVPSQTEAVRRIGTATLLGVPEIPDDVRAAVQRYQNSRAAQFEDWLPDGSMLISTRFGATDQLHHVRVPGAQRTQITFGQEPITGTRAVPGSDRFVMTRDSGGDEWFQLFLRGLTGEARQLTEPGTRNQSPVFSKDGSLLVWAMATRGSPSYSLLAIDPRNPGKPREIHRADGAITPQHISADNSRLIFVRRLSNRESELHLLDIASGKTRRIAPDAAPAIYEDPRFIGRGDRIIAISDLGSDHRRLVEIDLTTGEQIILIPDAKWNVEQFDISSNDRVIAYSFNEDGHSRVVVRDRLTRRALPQPDLPRGVLTALKFTPDGDQLAIALTGATFAGDVWSWDVDKVELTRWTSSELGGLDPARLSEPELIRFPSFDGLSVPAFVYRPKALPAGTRTPVIIDIHGGPEAQSRPVWNYGAQYFADVLKATVILPNVRGSDGYGKAYLDLDNGARREDSVKDIGALLDWVGTQPGLDPARVAVYGQSYGGYMSLASMSHYSDRLVGGVARYGISDFASFLNNTEAYRRDNRRAEYGDERDPRMREVFARIAPLANVGRIRKPMLIMQGANDPRVPQSESDQIVERLRTKGVPTWYVLFADEGHGFHKKPNNDLRREVETVFLRQLFEGQK